MQVRQLASLLHSHAEVFLHFVHLLHPLLLQLEKLLFLFQLHLRSRRSEQLWEPCLLLQGNWSRVGVAHQKVQVHVFVQFSRTSHFVIYLHDNLRQVNFVPGEGRDHIHCREPQRRARGGRSGDTDLPGTIHSWLLYLKRLFCPNFEKVLRTKSGH